MTKNYNTIPLAPVQLSFAINECSLRAPKLNEESFTAEVPAYSVGNFEVGSCSPPKIVPNISVELIRREIRDKHGKMTLGRVYEGLLYVDSDDVEFAGGVKKLDDWLARHLGKRCVRVKVHGWEENSADVTAEFLFEERIAAAAASSYHAGIDDLAENHDDHFTDSIDAENP